MGDLLFIVFLAAVGALVWLKLNQGSTTRLDGIKRKAKSATWIKLVEVALLLCAGAMGSFFAYQLLSPISVLLAVIAAVLVIFFNMAEGLILRSTVNSFRHSNILVGGIGVITVVMLMLYSITAGSSVIETFLNKHDDIKKYYQYEELASKQRIESAQAGILQAQMKAREKSPYDYLNNPAIAQAQANAALFSSQEYSRMAQLMKDKAPDLKIAFGFDHESIAFLMALVLELSIICVVIYEQLYVKNEALLASVRYENKTLDWNVNPHQLNNLSLEKSPAPETIALPYSLPQVGFSGISGAKLYLPQPSREGLATVPSEASLASRDALPPSQSSVSDRLKLPSQVYAVGETQPERVATTGDTQLAPKPVQERVFNQWLELIKQGGLSPSVRPAKTLILENQLTVGVKLAEGLASDWLDRAYNLGVLELNPDYTNGKPKYILASQYKAGRVVLVKQEAA